MPRKNYTYPDLPKGYQISQYELPLCEDGWLDIDLDDGSTKRIRIRRVHLEEDTGRSVHEGGSSLHRPQPRRRAADGDRHRGRHPLAEEAYAYMTKLRAILRTLGVNSGDMEKGALRCEPNISVRTLAQRERGEYGTKVEVKNLNCFRSMRSADCL